MLHVKPLPLRQQALKVVEVVAAVDLPAMNKVRGLSLGLYQTAAHLAGASQSLGKRILFTEVQMQHSVIVTLERTTTAPSLPGMKGYAKIAILEETVLPVAIMIVEEVDAVEVVEEVIMTDIAEL